MITIPTPLLGWDGSPAELPNLGFENYGKEDAASAVDDDVDAPPPGDYVPVVPPADDVVVVVVVDDLPLPTGPPNP
jgi:hypothetical protein